MTEKIETQKVWRTMSELPNGSGFVIWDVREIISDEPEPLTNGVFNTSDGKQIAVWPNHFFTLQKALEFLFDQWTKWDDLYIIHSSVNGSDWHGPVNK